MFREMMRYLGGRMSMVEYLTRRRDRFRETIKKQLSFSIEWRDQSIRRLELLNSMRLEKIVELSRTNAVLQAQLDETARRKSLRDEECNRLRGKVDGLREENGYLNRFIKALVGWLNEKNQTIERQAKQIESQEEEIRQYQGTIRPRQLRPGLRFD